MIRTFLATAVALIVVCHGALAQSEPPLATARQLVVVTTPDWNATTGELRRFTRANARAKWQPVDEAVQIVVGRTGLAWGVGYDHHADRSGTAGPRKREGDGRSPAGVFALGSVFGFAPADSMQWVHLPYLPLAPGSECVDDTASVHYNDVVNRNEVGRVDWDSAERMRQIAQYRLGVIVGYNSAPVRARGSCIFLHIWGGPGSTTAGCTALAETELARLVAWLDPRARPALVQLPASVYAQLRDDWRLPQLRR